MSQPPTSRTGSDATQANPDLTADRTGASDAVADTTRGSDSGTFVAGSGASASSGMGSAGAGISAGSEISGSASISARSGVSSRGDGKTRSRFDSFELATVLSHYDVGVIQGIQEYPRGSRKAPKLIIKTDHGVYLLKRRARGKDDPYKVAFCHGLQLFLADRQFPLPHLIGTRQDNNSMLQLGGRIYELFEYIKGTPYDVSLEATSEAGRILALFHKLLLDYKSPYDPPRGSYHNARSVHSALQTIPQTMNRVESEQGGGASANVAELVGFLNQSYIEAATKVEDMGLAKWPAQIIHSDWHPGNMLFRGQRVVAVIDYDAARIQQRIIDAANGALQFSILGGGEDPTQWPEYIDESRFKRFIRGYDSVPQTMLSRAELRCIPWLMIEALVAESVIPIAATGSFARMEGTGFMQMVQRKIRWLQNNADNLVRAVDS